ncbi:MAG: Threonine-tRNA ligase [Parcubacteria group bacterium GW2011_GWA2_52_8]|nr:MAG: Threonine-tRNA ligase [Parcubacteria group bacterium GW2011_GWA2_52_8]
MPDDGKTQGVINQPLAEESAKTTQTTAEVSIEARRHSAAHLLALAVQEMYPGTKFGIGPAIEHGFYYDFEFKEPISSDDLAKIEAKMRVLASEKLGYEHSEMPIAEAKEWAEKQNQPYKKELIEKLASENESVASFYQTGSFLDLCKGPHVSDTSQIGPFKLTHLAGAYWLGDENNQMLTRVYGTAFATKDELEAHLKQIEEAKKRDHKKLGIELDLFTFSELVGPGLPLWTPRGTAIRNLLDNYVWELRKKRGYVRVEIPHITKKDLYVKSGHWDKFQDQLFQIKTREGHIFALKPMNCPHHTQIFARRAHSYREMPQRYANTTMQYRDEQSGELTGLSRVRAISIDDAHVFCRASQIKEEILKIWDIIDEFYATFGFPLEVRLSLHDPKQKEKYLGSPKLWDEAEATLRAIAKQHKSKPAEALGEAAFYGPKVDFIAHDSLGREWQVATIQLDMNQPERFDLYCVNEKGEKERVVMIHAAIMGSLERFLSILIEHFAGAFPVWLAPTQVMILSINDEMLGYADLIAEELRAKNLRVEIDSRSESIGKKIREAEMQKTPYMLIVGKKERDQKTVSVRQRGERDLGGMKLDKFIEKIQKEIETKSI